MPSKIRSSERPEQIGPVTPCPDRAGNTMPPRLRSGPGTAPNDRARLPKPSVAQLNPDLDGKARGPGRFPAH